MTTDKHDFEGATPETLAQSLFKVNQEQPEPDDQPPVPSCRPEEQESDEQK